MFYVAQKIASKEIFSVVPQQSDYQFLLWEEDPVEKQEKKKKSKGFIKGLIPGFMVVLLVRLRKSVLHVISLFSAIGDGDKKHFKKVKLD